MKGAKGKGALSKQTEETNLKRKKQQAASKEDKAKKQLPARKSQEAKKDPNKPKRPPTPFFVFLEEFRKTFVAANPSIKAVSAVGKAGGDKWKTMTEADKAPYVAKAKAKKAEYEKNMKAYNAKQDKATEDAAGNESDANEEEEMSEEEEEDDE